MQLIYHYKCILGSKFDPLYLENEADFDLCDFFSFFLIWPLEIRSYKDINAHCVCIQSQLLLYGIELNWVLLLKLIVPWVFNRSENNLEDDPRATLSIFETSFATAIPFPLVAVLIDKIDVTHDTRKFQMIHK